MTGNMKMGRAVWALARVLACGGVAVLLAACDYFGSFMFTIQNNTGEEIHVSYVEQLRSWEDILPTYNHGDDYEAIHLAVGDTTVVIHPYESLSLNYEVGSVNSDFPTASDTPESWDIVPLWRRIVCIVVGTDTLSPDAFAQDKWVRNGSDYTLTME